MVRHSISKLSIPHFPLCEPHLHPDCPLTFFLHFICFIFPQCVHATGAVGCFKRVTNSSSMSRSGVLDFCALIASATFVSSQRHTL